LIAAGKRLILTNGDGIGVLAVDRLAELGGIGRDRASTREKARWLLPTWSGSDPSISPATPVLNAMRSRWRHC
jgi:hypothetical protein